MINHDNALRQFPWLDTSLDDAVAQASGTYRLPTVEGCSYNPAYDLHDAEASTSNVGERYICDTPEHNAEEIRDPDPANQPLIIDNWINFEDFAFWAWTEPASKSKK
ncbi:hypothetical protein MRB53_042309 [Persea americana]|nr:hypothetical protein MRB53_042309 [Persea americana]